LKRQRIHRQFHGIGHQAHLYLSRPDPAELETTIQAVAKLGLRNQITEMDVSLRERDGAALDGEEDELLARQARRYADFFRMFRRNRERIDAVLVWGISDEDSWHKSEEPLLFSELQPKPAFWAVIDEAARPVK
jgi:endo-1,4-beta-xylanase